MKLLSPIELHGWYCEARYSQRADGGSDQISDARACALAMRSQAQSSTSIFPFFRPSFPKKMVP